MTNKIKTARPARWIALALVGALALAATPSAFARPGGAPRSASFGNARGRHARGTRDRRKLRARGCALRCVERRGAFA